MFVFILKMRRVIGYSGYLEIGFTIDFFGIGIYYFRVLFLIMVIVYEMDTMDFRVLMFRDFRCTFFWEVYYLRFVVFFFDNVRFL